MQFCLQFMQARKLIKTYKFILFNDIKRFISIVLGWWWLSLCQAVCNLQILQSSGRNCNLNTCTKVVIFFAIVFFFVDNPLCLHQDHTKRNLKFTNKVKVSFYLSLWITGLKATLASATPLQRSTRGDVRQQAGLVYSYNKCRWGRSLFSQYSMHLPKSYYSL